jgi:hypothetical protein
MFRRLFWIGFGAFLALWGRRKAVQTVDRYVPKVVVEKTAASMKTLVGQVAAAQEEAKTALRNRRASSADSGSDTDAADSTDSSDS